MGGSPFPQRMEGGPVESDLRPQRPELLLKELTTVLMSRQVIGGFRLPPMDTVLIWLRFLGAWHGSWQAGSRCLMNIQMNE